MPALTRYPEQDADAAEIAGKDNWLLLLDPRLGKTPVSLVGMVRRGARRAAVVTKAITREHWRRHFEAWAPGVEYRVVSYDQISRSPATVDDLKQFKPDALILDEGQRCKSPDAKRTRAIYGPRCKRVGGLVEHAGALWVLSGTLTPNHVGEAWTHLRAMNRTELGYLPFCYHFAEVWETPYGPLVKDIRPERVDELRALVRPISRRRRFRDVFPHLPPALWTTESLALEDTGWAALKKGEEDAAVRSVRRDLARARTDEEREAILARAKAPLATHRNLLAIIKAPLVVEAVTALLESGVEKVAVFAWHHTMLGALEAGLESFETVRLDGNVSETQRVTRLAVFQEGTARVALCQVETAGEGVALHAARHVVIAELPWSPGAVIQAARRIVTPDRLDRPEVIVYSLSNTIDEVVAQVLQRKVEHLAVFNTL